MLVFFAGTILRKIFLKIIPDSLSLQQKLVAAFNTLEVILNFIARVLLHKSFEKNDLKFL